MTEYDVVWVVIRTLLMIYGIKVALNLLIKLVNSAMLKHIKSMEYKDKIAALKYEYDATHHGGNR